MEYLPHGSASDRFASLCFPLLANPWQQHHRSAQSPAVVAGRVNDFGAACCDDEGRSKAAVPPTLVGA
jgi:hypothetical protein